MRIAKLASKCIPPMLFPAILVVGLGLIYLFSTAKIIVSPGSPDGINRQKMAEIVGFGPPVQDSDKVLELGLGNAAKLETLPVLAEYFLDDRPIEEGLENMEYNKTFGMFTVNGRPIIWMFWDYSKIPAYVKMAIRTVQCYNELKIHVAFINETWIKLHLHDFLPPQFDSLIPAHKADYIRCLLLMTYGGMWIDADTLALGPMIGYFHLLANLHIDLIGYSWVGDDAPFGIGAMGPARSNLSIFQEWKRSVDHKLNKYSEELNEYSETRIATNKTLARLYPLLWNDVLSGIIEQIVIDHLKRGDFKYAFLNGHQTWGQMDNAGLITMMFDKMPIKLLVNFDNYNHDKIGNSRGKHKIGINNSDEIIFEQNNYVENDNAAAESKGDALKIGTNDQIDDSKILARLKSVKYTELLLLHNSMYKRKDRTSSISEFAKSNTILAGIIHATLLRCTNLKDLAKSFLTDAEASSNSSNVTKHILPTPNLLQVITIKALG